MDKTTSVYDLLATAREAKPYTFQELWHQVLYAESKQRKGEEDQP